MACKKCEEKMTRTKTREEKEYKDLMNSKSDFAFYEAVRRMLPKNKLGAQMLTKLRVYKGSEHKHAAQKPEQLDL